LLGKGAAFTIDRWKQSAIIILRLMEASETLKDEIITGRSDDLKKTMILLAMIVLILSLNSIAWAAGEVTVLVDNQKVTFPDQKPYIDGHDRTLVPVRFISEAMGAAVDWEGTTRTVTIIRRQNTIKLRIGESKATVNDEVKTFDTKAVITNSRTMVPLRFISETLGARVDGFLKPVR